MGPYFRIEGVRLNFIERWNRGRERLRFRSMSAFDDDGAGADGREAGLVGDDLGEGVDSRSACIDLDGFVTVPLAAV